MSRNKREGFLSLLLKQTISAILCFIVVFSLSQSSDDRLSGYASALKEALRSEYDTTEIEKWIHELIPEIDLEF